jgi:Domain of unknown function (DUF4956)
MPDWLTPQLESDPAAALLPLAWRIGLALGLGWMVAGVYRWARRGEEIAPTFQTTLILLAALIAMATQIIGDNIARAFSLVGALSVVRFRTVVKDTQDTAFVIFAVVVGMAVGANHLAVGIVGLVVVAIASIALWPPRRANGWQGPGVTLSFRVGVAEGIRIAAEATLAASAESYDMVSAGTARQGSAFELAYRVRLRPGCSPAGLVAELNGLDGVDNVQLSRET